MIMAAAKAPTIVDRWEGGEGAEGKKKEKGRAEKDDDAQKVNSWMDIKFNHRA